MIFQGDELFMLVSSVMGILNFLCMILIVVFLAKIASRMNSETIVEMG